MGEACIMSEQLSIERRPDSTETDSVETGKALKGTHRSAIKSKFPLFAKGSNIPWRVVVRKCRKSTCTLAQELQHLKP
jgi:hypothetical protein